MNTALAKGEEYMGLKDKIFGKKNTETAPAGNAGGPSEGAAGTGFCFAVADVFNLNDSADRVVVGYVFGRINKGDAIYISNPGTDDSEVAIGIASDLMVYKTSVETAENTNLSIVIENGSKCLLKTGTVIHSREASLKGVHDAYVNALGDGYISFRKLELGQADYDRMSVTDIVELFQLYLSYCKTNANDTSDELVSRRNDISNAFAKQICSKVLSSKEIYVLMSRRTGEPAMMSYTYKAENGSYVTTPPNLLIVTQAYSGIWKKNYDPSKYDFLKVENGPDGKGIYNFLGSAFYLNGACGVGIIYERLVIDAAMFVPKPEYKDVPEVQIPVTNPDLERWLLMIGQLNPPANDEEKNVLSILYTHLFRELGNARFLVPMKLKGDIGKPDESGNVTLKQGTTISFAMQAGKGDRSAVNLYTDWKRLRERFPESEGWDGMIQPLEGMIETFDCVINVTDHPEAGVYIDKETFETNIRKKE